MRALWIVVILLLPVAIAASPHTGSRTYVGPTHDTTARFLSCAVPSPYSVDGVCFKLDGTSRAVDIRIQDASMLPILVHVFFRDAHGIAVGASTFLCTGSWSGPVPTDAVILAVWMIPDPGVNTPGDCPILHGQATVGTVTAAFT